MRRRGDPGERGASVGGLGRGKNPTKRESSVVFRRILRRRGQSLSGEGTPRSAVGLCQATAEVGARLFSARSASQVRMFSVIAARVTRRLIAFFPRKQWSSRRRTSLR